MDTSLHFLETSDVYVSAEDKGTLRDISHTQRASYFWISGLSGFLMGGKCAKENNNYKTVTKEPCTFLNEGAMLFRKFFEFVKKIFC